MPWSMQHTLEHAAYPGHATYMLPAPYVQHTCNMHATYVQHTCHIHAERITDMAELHMSTHTRLHACLHTCPDTWPHTYSGHVLQCPLYSPPMLLYHYLRCHEFAAVPVCPWPPPIRIPWLQLRHAAAFTRHATRMHSRAIGQGAFPAPTTPRRARRCRVCPRYCYESCAPGRYVACVLHALYGMLRACCMFVAYMLDVCCIRAQCTLHLCRRGCAHMVCAYHS